MIFDINYIEFTEDQVVAAYLDCLENNIDVEKHFHIVFEAKPGDGLNEIVIQLYSRGSIVLRTEEDITKFKTSFPWGKRIAIPIYHLLDTDEFFEIFDNDINSIMVDMGDEYRDSSSPENLWLNESEGMSGNLGWIEYLSIMSGDQEVLGYLRHIYSYSLSDDYREYLQDELKRYLLQEHKMDENFHLQINTWVCCL